MRFPGYADGKNTLFSGPAFALPSLCCGKKPSSRCQFPRAAASELCERGRGTGPADCSGTGVTERPSREASGAVELSSNRQSSGIRVSELESLRARDTGPGKGGHVPGDGRQAGMGPCEGPEPARPPPSGWCRSLQKKGTRQVPAGPREWAQRGSSQVTILTHTDLNSG